MQPARVAASPNLLVLRFALAFFALVLLFSVLVRVDIALLDGVTTAWLTHHAAHVVAASLRLVGLPVTDVGNQLSLDSSQFEIVANCTGIEIVGLFVAAILAFPSPWRLRLKGLALGVPVLMGLNLIRMMSLVYIGAHSARALDYGHLYVWPMLLLATALGIWLAWARSVAGGERLVG